LSIPSVATSLCIKFDKQGLEPEHLKSTTVFMNECLKDRLGMGYPHLHINFDFAAEDQIFIYQSLLKAYRFGIRVDPLWAENEELLELADEWGVQGRHSERWVRYYSEGQLKDLARMALKKKAPLDLTLCHSKRWEQYSLLISLLESEGSVL